MRKIYKKIAKKHGVTVTEVKRDMEAAIAHTYCKPNKTESEEAMQNRVYCKNEMPTTEELIRFLANEIENEDTAQ